MTSHLWSMEQCIFVETWKTLIIIFIIKALSQLCLGSLRKHRSTSKNAFRCDLVSTCWEKVILVLKNPKKKKRKKVKKLKAILDWSLSNIDLQFRMHKDVNWLAHSIKNWGNPQKCRINRKLILKNSNNLGFIDRKNRSSISSEL